MQQIGFFEQFTRPGHPLEVPWCDPAAAGPGPREFRITDAWRLAAPESASAQVAHAIDDLRAFFAGAGVAPAVTAAAAVPASAAAITFRRGRGVNGIPESFTLRLSPAGIVIEGADDSGIMYGTFHLEELLRFRQAPIVTAGTVRRSPALRTRILRSPMSCFHRAEMATVLDAYPATWLQRLAHHGYNAIWLRGRLREMAVVDAFPEFGADSATVLAALNTLVQRASEYGVKVYLYFNEPLGLPPDDEVFQVRPHLRGQPHASEGVCSLCTSTPEVQEFLRAGMHHVFARVPGLAGAILITASEFHTHCFSHLATVNRERSDWQADMGCPRCRARTPADVVGEVVRCIRDGVKSAAPGAEVIAWNWSWRMYEAEPQAGVIRALPADVILMGDFERGGRRVTGGVSHVVDEYSLCSIGPSERFKGVAAAARAQSRPLYAKLQIGTTHEIGTVPHFPLYAHLARKIIRLRHQGGTGAMACWNFGNILSLNTEIVNWYSWRPAPRRIADHLLKIATRDYGTAAAPGVVRAWEHFCAAATHYPFSVPLLYWGPQHFGPAYPLMLHPVDRHMPIPWLLPAEISYDTKFSWMEYTEFGDQLRNYLGPFPPATFIACFDAFLREWRAGYEGMVEALAQTPERLLVNAVRERTVCGAVLSQFVTTRNFTEFTMRRDAYWAAPVDARPRAVLERMLTIAEDEIANAEFCRGLALANPMLGFHGEAFGYVYSPAKIDVKLAATRKVVDDIRALLG